MLKMIHGADFHLDSPFSGLTPERAARRRGEQRELLERLAALCAERRADLVLLSGDLLDSAQMFRETGAALSRALGAIGCPVFISPGNHDFYTPASPYGALNWPENVHIFKSGQIEAVTLPALNCTVYGRAFTSPRQSESPLADFHADGNGLRVMALHGEVGQGGEYGPVTPAEIAASGLHYLALGHIHRYDGLQKAGNTYWAYSGCPEGRGFDETGDKGVLYVEMDEKICRAELVPLCRHRYRLASVDVTGAEDILQAVLSALPDGTREDVYRLTLTGERGAQGVDLRRLEKALAPRFYGLTLSDGTRLSQDLWSRAGEDTLTGLFLREMKARVEADPDNELLRQAARFGLAALEGGEDVAL